jgi:molecular chaperone DnaK
MVKDAEAHAEEDRKQRELVDARNQGEALIHTTEKTLGEVGEQVSAEDKKAVEDAVADLRQAIEGDSTEDIKQKTEHLSQVSSKLGEALYRAQQEGAGDGSAEAGQSGDGSAEEGVVDADFEEVDDDQKRGGQSSS